MSSISIIRLPKHLPVVRQVRTQCHLHLGISGNLEYWKPGNDISTSLRSGSPMRNPTSRWHPRHGSSLPAHGQNYSSSNGEEGAAFSSRVLLAGTRQQHQIDAVGWDCYSRGILDCYNSVHLLDGQGRYQGTSGCGVTEGTSAFHGTWVSIWTMIKQQSLVELSIIIRCILVKLAEQETRTVRQSILVNIEDVVDFTDFRQANLPSSSCLGDGVQIKWLITHLRYFTLQQYPLVQPTVLPWNLS